MASQVFEFSVDMTCEGCAKSVQNVLGKKQGIQDVQIDLENKKVSVTSVLSSDELLTALKKTGKACEFLGQKK